MTDISSNDESVSFVAANDRTPDAYGQAALLLVESMLHGLIDHSLLTVEQAVELVDIAGEVKGDIGADLGDTPVTLQTSLALLANIGTSLRADLR